MPKHLHECEEGGCTELVECDGECCEDDQQTVVYCEKHKEKDSMTIALTFSGGVQHEQDVPVERCQAIADKLKELLTAFLDENAASGTGSILLGPVTVDLLVQSKNKGINYQD